MINPRDNPAQWALFVAELDQASQHLANLISALQSDPTYCDEDFTIDLGHVMAHLNRAWARRNLTRDLTDDEWEASHDYPKDLPPIA